MRNLAGYMLVFYGAGTAASAGSSIRRGRVAPAGGLALALLGITMIMAALGLLLGLGAGIVVAIISIVLLSTLAGYNAWVIEGGYGLRRQTARSILATLLLGLIIFGG